MNVANDAEDPVLRVLSIAVQGFINRFPKSRMDVRTVGHFIRTSVSTSGKTAHIGLIRARPDSFISLVFRGSWERANFRKAYVKATRAEVEKIAAVYFTRPYLVERVEAPAVEIAQRLLGRP
jgi:hypothetical protein